MRVTRVIPLALGALLSAAGVRAQPEGLPAIFSDQAPQRAARKLEAPEAMRPRLPISPQMRAALTERAAARLAASPAPMKSAGHGWIVDSGDAILMERYVVNALTERVVKPERQPNPIYHAFSSGDLWVHTKWGALPQIYWSLGSVHDRGDGQQRLPVAGATSTSPRAELRFVWPW